jgi:hypothetical protein
MPKRANSKFQRRRRGKGFMIKEKAIMWAEALESGKYKQGRGKLASEESKGDSVESRKA